MSALFLSLLLIFELIQQATLMNFMLFLNILKILKVSFSKFWRENLHIPWLVGSFFLEHCVKLLDNTVETAMISKAMFKFWSIFHIQNPWCGFTRDNSFLQTPSQLLPGKQESLSPSTSRHINNITALIGIFSSILNCS